MITNIDLTTTKRHSTWFRFQNGKPGDVYVSKNTVYVFIEKYVQDEHGIGYEYLHFMRHEFTRSYDTSQRLGEAY